MMQALANRTLKVFKLEIDDIAQWPALGRDFAERMEGNAC
eukprot:gene5784-5711_t